MPIIVLFYIFATVIYLKYITKMKKSLFIYLLFAAVCFAMTSCSDDERRDEVRVDILGKAPIFMKKSSMELMAKKDLPNWLAEKITDLEKNAPPAALYEVYLCRWKSQSIYYIYDWFSSCHMCEVYDVDGKKVELNGTEDVMDFSNNSTDWKCIYVIKAV